MGDKPHRIIDPIDQKELTEEEAHAPVQGRLRPDELCEVCRTRERFAGWSLCWECSVESMGHLAEGPNVLDHWDVVSQHQGDFLKKSFAWAQIESTNGPLDLARRVFKICDFTGAVFYKVNFGACRFDKVDFTGARFTECSFRKARFRNCIMRFSRFRRTDLRGARLDCLDVSRSVFDSDTALSQCAVENARIVDVRFEACSLVGARFNGNCKILKSRFHDCDLRRCDLTHADLVPVETPRDALAIEGPRTRTEDARLTFTQGRKIEFSEDVNLDDMNVTFCPTSWPLAKQATSALVQSLLRRHTCVGLTYSLSPLLNAIGIGCFVGMVYCVVSGAFQKEDVLMSSFLWSAAIASAPPLIAGVYASVRLEKVRKVRMLKPEQ
jgi:fluoroquinolone resistance protein